MFPVREGTVRETAVWCPDGLHPSDCVVWECEAGIANPVGVKKLNNGGGFFLGSLTLPSRTGAS